MTSRRDDAPQPSTEKANSPLSSSSVPTPNRRIGLLSRDEIRRRILLVDPAFARRYRQRDGE